MKCSERLNGRGQLALSQAGFRRNQPRQTTVQRTSCRRRYWQMT
jgi:hypothetical protein